MRAFNALAVPKPALTFNWSFPGDVDLEIGAGQGLHALNYASTHPERTLIAVEKTHTRHNLMARRHQQHPHVTNLHVFHADASAFVTHFVPDASFSRIFLLYPNPYPKSKHANLRWHNRPFFALLKSKLKPGGELTVATNLRWYADEAAEKYVTLWRLEPMEFTARLDHPRTHFERKYQARGQTCWNIVLRKPACHPLAANVE